MSAMDYDGGGGRELVEVMKAAQQTSSATGDGEEIAAVRGALGLALAAVGLRTAGGQP